MTAPQIDWSNQAQLQLRIRAVTFTFLFLWAGALVASGQLTYTTPYAFSTLAGQSSASGSADGTGLGAQFHGPDGIGTDLLGNVYVVDQYNSTVRKVTPSGVVTTIAGQPKVVGTADGRLGISRLNHPWGLTVDKNANIYVADENNSTIRLITLVSGTWMTTTIAGFAGFPGSVDGTNHGAQFNQPNGLAVDSAGNVYVADYGGHAIRMIKPVGSNWVVTTIAGQPGNPGFADGTNNAALFNNPTDVAVDALGNLFVSDLRNDVIRMITPYGTNWVVTTIAGQPGVTGSADGTNNFAQFYYPNGVAIDGAGNLYVAVFADYTIRKVTPLGGTNWAVTTIGGLANNSGNANGTGSAARFNHATFLATDRSGNLYVADRDNNTIRRGYPASVPPTMVVSGTRPPFVNSLFGFNLVAVPGQSVAIDGSTDLRTWSPIITNVVGAGVSVFSDPQTALFPRRYYRVRLP